MDKIDYKKTEKHLYLPRTPAIAEVPEMAFFAVDGQGEGYEADFSGERRHHEIYLGDPRRTAPEKLRTVIRHPVRKRA